MKLTTKEKIILAVLQNLVDEYDAGDLYVDIGIIRTHHKELVNTYAEQIIKELGGKVK